MILLAIHVFKGFRVEGRASAEMLLAANTIPMDTFRMISAAKGLLGLIMLAIAFGFAADPQPGTATADLRPSMVRARLA